MRGGWEKKEKEEDEEEEKRENKEGEGEMKERLPESEGHASLRLW